MKIQISDAMKNALHARCGQKYTVQERGEIEIYVSLSNYLVSPRVILRYLPHNSCELIVLEHQKANSITVVLKAAFHRTTIFSTSDRLLSDVLLLSKVREIWTFPLIPMYERPNLRGRERP